MSALARSHGESPDVHAGGDVVAVARTPGAPMPRRAGLRWSYRLKVPLALTAVAVLSGVAVATTTYLLVYRYVEANAVAQAQRLAATLARSLVQPVLSNDVWQAYRTVRASSLSTPAAEAPSVRIVVLDARGEVFASLDPLRHPLGTVLKSADAPFADAARWVTAGGSSEPYLREDASTGSLIVAERLLGEEEALVGGVIVLQEHGISRAQARAVAERLALLGVAAFAIVAAIGWVAGRRIIRPLHQLRTAMQQAPAVDVEPAVAEVSRLNDEVGDLGRAFLSMMDELAAKRELEREMLQAERMAGIGRLSAAIAHEVNNPLGGMLHAIANRRLRGNVDDATARTLDLLQRGLQQIHSTVNALLNEARRELHELRDEDLNDVFLLLHPEADHEGCSLDWRVTRPLSATLPSVAVRQTLLNLSLNAIAAAGAAGRVRVDSDERDGEWRVSVANSGALLDATQLERLVTGQQQRDGDRTSLGLWVTARILHTLGGSLELASPDPADGYSTELVARFPLHPA